MKTDYDIGDVVWFIEGHDFVCGEVFEITIREGMQLYQVRINEREFYTLSGNIYPTEKELVKAILDRNNIKLDECQ